jgi:hypothetical protein
MIRCPHYAIVDDEEDEEYDFDMICSDCLEADGAECWNCQDWFYAPRGERTCPACLAGLSCRVCGSGPNLTAFDRDVCGDCKTILSVQCESCKEEYYEGDTDGACPACGYNPYTDCPVCYGPITGAGSSPICSNCLPILSGSDAGQVEATLRAFSGVRGVQALCPGESPRAEEGRLRILTLENKAPDAKVAVGMAVQLKVEHSAGKPLTNIRWKIGGKVVKSYVTNEKKGKRTDLLAQDLQQKTVAFYWIAPGACTVAVSAQADGVPLETSAAFQIESPTFIAHPRSGALKVELVAETSLAWRFTFGAGLRIDDSLRKLIHAEGASDGAVRTRLLQKYGLIQSRSQEKFISRLKLEHSAPAGIEVRWEVDVPESAGGELNCLQLMTIYRRKTKVDGGVVESSSNDQLVLDEDVRYLKERLRLKAGESGELTFDDSPCTGFLGSRPDEKFKEVEVKEEFRLYLTYKPEGSTSIWVPLVCLCWGWGGKATFDHIAKTGELVENDCPGPCWEAVDDLPEWDRKSVDIL